MTTFTTRPQVPALTSLRFFAALQVYLFHLDALKIKTFTGVANRLQMIVYAILLTRGGEPPVKFSFSLNWITGIGTGVAVFGLLSGVILTSRALTGEVRPPPEATVRQIGTQLMGKFILPLEVTGLLLTAALIGAVLIAMREKEGE